MESENSAQRLKAFIWLVMNDALRTNHARLNKSLSTYDLCVICGTSAETMLHTLHDCLVARELWKSVGNRFIKDSFFQQPLLPWLEGNVFYFLLWHVAPFGIAVIYIFLWVIPMLILF